MRARSDSAAKLEPPAAGELDRRRALEVRPVAAREGSPSTQIARSLLAGRVVDPLDQVPGDGAAVGARCRRPPTSASWCGAGGSRPTRRRRRAPRSASGVRQPRSCRRSGRRRACGSSPSRRRWGRSLRSARTRRGAGWRAARARRSRGCGPSILTSRLPGRRWCGRAAGAARRSQSTQNDWLSGPTCGPRRAEHQLLAEDADVAPALAVLAVGAQRHRPGRQGQVGSAAPGPAPRNLPRRHRPTVLARA